MMKSTPWFALLVLLLSASALGVSACNPERDTRIIPGGGVRDYYTLRHVSGALETRDVKPEPRPREAITGDDYFQVKLEHIYMGDELDREVGNVVIISQLEGVFPEGTQCELLEVRDAIGLDLAGRERSNAADAVSCAYKHVLAINPVFANGHVTFDSAFISPPFRMGRREVGLRFIIAQLTDVELARKVVRWAEEQVNDLDQLGLGEFKLGAWQSKLVNVGFTVANYILDYFAKPQYVLEFETDFVPIESVGGVDSPQNLLMGGDFVIVGFPRDGARDGALVMQRELVFDSGRLYHRADRTEYRDGAYIVFKVVRQSRFPRALPVALAQVNREIERGTPGEEIKKLTRGVILDLQDARVLNETEGRYLLDAADWLVEARAVDRALGAALDGARAEPSEWPLALRALPASLGPDVALVSLLERAHGHVRQLEQRLYENFGATPGIWQEECIVMRDLTQRLADSYGRLHPGVQRAYEDLQLRRSDLQLKPSRSASEEQAFAQLSEADAWLSARMRDLPERLDEPPCPGLRR